MTNNVFCCPLCKTELTKDVKCCGYEFKLSNGNILYDHERILLSKFPKDFLLNKTLNTNGHLSYFLLPDGSVSLPERSDVKAFAQYIHDFYKPGKVLDVGCGPLETPGYLLKIQKPENSFYGLDPIPDIKFKGTRVIGCCEYMPFPDESLDTLIFATTIDHVCNLNQTFKEAQRVLKKGGKLICWHWYNEKPVYNFLKKVMHSLSQKSRYYPYPNGVSFVIPSGGIDPFHKEYINPKKLFKIAKRNRLVVEDVSSSGSSYNIPNRNYFFTMKKL